MQPNNDQHKLKKLIDLGYQLFSSYQLNPDHMLDACRCGGCTSDDDHHYLIQIALKNIELDVFKFYVNASYSAGETPLNEFKYFLPLFLDFMVQGEHPFLSENYFFQRIASYTQQDWTAEELSFLQQFAEAYLQHHLHDESNAELTYIVNYLEMFQSYLFNTEKLADLCLHHPSAYCLIDYATNIINHGYDDFENSDDDMYTARVKNILLPWKSSHDIRQHFIDQYHAFKHKGHRFDVGNANWVNDWITGVQQGKY